MATFKIWLSQFEEEDSVFGDLADDVAIMETIEEVVKEKE